MKRIADFKEKHKDLIGNLLPENEKDNFTKYNVVNVLKNRDQKGRRVLIQNQGGKMHNLFFIFILKNFRAK